MSLLPPKNTLAYVQHFGGRCRECADNRGVCPNTGLPCNPEQRVQAIKWVVDAINYGTEHGFMKAGADSSGVRALEDKS